MSDSLTESDVDEIRRMQNHLKDGDDFEVDWGYWNLIDDPIAQINPRKFMPDKCANYKHFSEVVFISGNVSFAVGRPETLEQKLNEYFAKNV